MSKVKKEMEIKDHQLSASHLRIWWRLIRQNKIDNWKMVFRVWMFVILTQPFQLLQSIVFKRRVNKTDIFTSPPFFILGHWRSGTTHLHYIFARDPQFSYLNNYQAFLMNVAVIGRTWLKWLLTPLMPKGRPQDNIKMSVDEPAEDEQPLTNMTACSGMQSFYFPKNISYYDKFNLFKGIKPWEKRRWRRHYIYVCKLIAYCNGKRRLLLKNPHNTSRVKELLEIWPKAKFVFIHRNPYEVFHSTRHLYRKTISTQFLQDFSEQETEDRIIYCFVTTLQKYLEEKDMIPKENLVEISFKELDADSWGTTQKIYTTIGLGGIEQAQPHIQEYLESVKDYEKNAFPDLESRIIERINNEWDFAFKEWGYEKINPS